MRKKVNRFIDKKTNTAKYTLTVIAELEIAQELEDLIPESLIIERLWKALKRQVEEV